MKALKEAWAALDRFFASKPKRHYCKKCRRLLTSKASIERGMGPCCAKGRVRDDRTIDMFDGHDVSFRPVDPSAFKGT